MKPKNIIIPYKCLLPLVEDTNLLKAFCIWGKLKLKFSHGSIHNIKSRKQELAKSLNICENTFRKNLSILKNKNLISFEQDGTLRLLNKYNIYSSTNIEPNSHEGRISHKYYRITEEDLNPDDIKLLALQHKKDQINYNNLKRIRNILLKSEGKIHSPKILSKVKGKLKDKAENILNKYKNIPAQAFKSNSTFGFLDDNMCGETIAKIFGKKTKQTGCKFLHKMKKLNKITLERRVIKLCNLTPSLNIKYYREMGYKNFIISNKALCVNLPMKWNVCYKVSPTPPSKNIIVSKDFI